MDNNHSRIQNLSFSDIFSKGAKEVMWLHRSIFLWICVLRFNPCTAKVNDSVTDVIFPLIRLIGGISLQKQLCTDKNKAVPVAEEFLNVEKNRLKEILRLKIGDQMKQLTDAAALIDTFPSPDSKVIDKTVNGLRALNKAKEDESRLTPGSFKDPSDLLVRSGELDKNLRQKNKNIDKTKFAEIEKILKEIEKTEGKDVKPESLSSQLTKLKDTMEICQYAVESISNYEDTYSTFYEFAGLSEQTGPYINLSRSIATVSSNYDDIAGFESAIPVLTGQSSSLRSSKQDLEKFSTLLKSVERILNISSSRSKKSLTIGLPNGIEDLKKLSKASENTMFLEKIVKKEDLKSIRTALEPISKTSVLLEEALNKLKSLKADPGVLTEYRQYKILVSNVLSMAEQAEQNQNIEQELQNIVPCVKQLKKDPNGLDLNKLEKITKHVEHINKKLKDFDAVMKKINSNEKFESFTSGFKSLRTGVAEFDSESDPPIQISVWDAARTEQFHTKYEAIFQIIQELDKNPFKLGGNDLPVSVLSETLENAKRSNLFDALKCLPSSAPDIQNLIDVGQKVEELKSHKNKLTAVTSVYSEALDFKTSVNQAITGIKKTIKNESTSVICKIFSRDSKSKIEYFLTTGSLLNDADLIRKSEASISKVSNPSDQVKQAAEQIKGAEFYNDGFRKSMSELAAEVEQFFKTISHITPKNLKDILDILESLSKLKGYSLKNVEKLDNPISKELLQSSDQQVRETAKDFEIVSALNMDFGTFKSITNFATSKENVLNPPPPQNTAKTKDFPLMIGWVGALALFSGFGFVWLVVSLCSCYLQKLRKEEIEAERRNRNIRTPPPPSFAYFEKKTGKSKRTSVLPKGSKSKLKEKTATKPSASISTAGTQSPAAAK